MASDPFDFSDVFTDLEDKIDKFMRDETTKEACAKVFAESTEELVYAKYTPWGDPRYDEYGDGISRRKENGGLKDWHNYHVLNIGKMNMTIINETMGNSLWNPEWNPRAWSPWEPGYITDNIENGGPYYWNHVPPPRPFMEKACDKFVDDYLLPSIHDIFFND